MHLIIHTPQHLTFSVSSATYQTRASTGNRNGVICSSADHANPNKGTFMQLQTGVTAIVFYVRDIERTITFYRDVLGLHVIAGGGTEAGEHHHYARAEAGKISLIFFTGEQRPGATPIVVFGVEKEIEAVVEELARRGAEIVLPVSEA